eukprot:scaffold58923_cov66-Phaeocystis_antarctica.AAC.6
MGAGTDPRDPPASVGETGLCCRTAEGGAGESRGSGGGGSRRLFRGVGVGLGGGGGGGNRRGGR